jgi:hypothetical protein
MTIILLEREMNIATTQCVKQVYVKSSKQVLKSMSSIQTCKNRLGYDQSKLSSHFSRK